jgi:hypothetical protein
MEVRSAAGQHDHGAWRVRLELFVVEPASQPDAKDARHDRVDAVLRMLVRHQLDPVGTLTLMTYGLGAEGSPTTIARRTDGGDAGEVFQSTSSGRTELKMLLPGWWIPTGDRPPKSVSMTLRRQVHA